MKLLIMQSSPASRPFHSLRSKYSPEHPFLKRPQYVIPLVWETKLYTHTKQRVKLRFCMFREEMERQTLNRIVESIPRI